MSKPKLTIDLQGPDGNVYAVIAKARQLVPADQLDRFIVAILDAQRPGANKTYEDMLALINSYVDLVDSSGMYPAYANKETGTDGLDEAAIMAAVDRLNEQLATLPDAVPCSLDGLYPEFDNPDHSPQIYLALVKDEMKAVEEKIRQAESGQREPLEQLRSMLRQCADALSQAGVA